MLLLSILAFLVPLAVYCWVLAWVNRRPKPTMVSGLWDCVGMLMAAGGILLLVGPALLHRLLMDLYLDAFGLEWLWVGWGLYFIVMLLGGGLLMWWRKPHTVIYNVDPEMLEHVVQHSLEALGLASVRKGNRLAIWNKDETNTTEDEAKPPSRSVLPPPCAELTVDAFPAMCHVSLHWLHDDGALRVAVEKRLAQDLENARTYDNPAANWLVLLTGLLGGIIFLTGSVWVLMNYLPPRHW